MIKYIVLLAFFLVGFSSESPAGEANLPKDDPACVFNSSEFTQNFEKSRPIHFKMVTAPNFKQIVGQNIKSQNNMAKEMIIEIGKLCETSRSTKIESAQQLAIPQTWSSGQCDELKNVSTLYKEAYDKAASLAEDAWSKYATYQKKLPDLRDRNLRLIQFRKQDAPGAGPAEESKYPRYDKTGLEKEVNHIFDENFKNGLSVLLDVIRRSNRYRYEKVYSLTHPSSLAKRRYRSCTGIPLPKIKNNASTYTSTDVEVETDKIRSH